MSHRRRIELGPQLVLDLDRLITTRMLIQANSGGGKSWALRRMIEQCHGHVQQLVLDPEGEFASLRERYDFVLAAREGGDTAADPRTAAELAARLLELEASAVLDLYELKPDHRQAFTALFLGAVVEAPRQLWHPVLIYVDEAHVYCPEKDKVQSSDAVIDLATRGRKRGFCLVAATQRLAKFDKDAAAELNNKLIGRTVLDDDLKRAGDELGFRTQEQRLQLRELGATADTEGEFFGFGPALGVRGVVRGRTGPVLTTHPKPGQRRRAPNPPAPAKIRALLPKLADLPAEAADRAMTMERLRLDLTNARRELAITKRALHEAQHAAPAPVVKRVEVPVIRGLHLAALTKLCARFEKATDRLAAEGAAARVVSVSVAQETKTLVGAIMRVSREVVAATPPITGRHADVVLLDDPAGASTPAQRRAAERFVAGAPALRHSAADLPIGRTTKVERVRGGVRVEGEVFPLTQDGPSRIRAGARRMLDALARRHPAPTTWTQVAQLARLSTAGGTFGTYCSDLRRAGLVHEQGEVVTLTDRGWAAIGRQPGELAPQTTEEVLALYRGVLRGGARRMVDALMGAYPAGLTREELSERAHVVTTGGTFGTYLSDLRRAGLLEERDGRVQASTLLMDPAAA